VPPIFSIIARLGQVDITEMFSVFNMGIGFCAVVAPAHADLAVAILGGNGKRAWRIGHAMPDAKRRVSLPQYRLVGQGKHFRPAERQ
jgi:phosphoribosylformylglycinamidine cyclo-ligase